ncbi:hypothetical protein CY34DRAFT_800318 [Suillus luteus UH-Slu-Lm8-n1]|uniref:Uncharacterized protein n=1 Tax=Suillus luteus UH-Slu-Lm8-n1 TaxID=930992 RepID=A0A0D0BKJ1_9AGAM|nr:hypothetical protein CY34DRAFT_800318 [Suillus luteus UH-Slu-Lm8-n1]
MGRNSRNLNAVSNKTTLPLPVVSGSDGVAQHNMNRIDFLQSNAKQSTVIHRR